MVDGGRRPIGGIVAGDTIYTIASIVNIICLMAGVAVFRSPLVNTVDMA